MTVHRMWIAAGCLVLGAVQAWDSHALAAEPFVQGAIAIAIALAPLAIAATDKTAVQLGAVVAAAALLILARMISAAHLPELVLAAVFPGVLVLLNHVRGWVPDGGPRRT